MRAVMNDDRVLLAQSLLLPSVNAIVHARFESGGLARRSPTKRGYTRTRIDQGDRVAVLGQRQSRERQT